MDEIVKNSMRKRIMLEITYVYIYAHKYYILVSHSKPIYNFINNVLTFCHNKLRTNLFLFWNIWRPAANTTRNNKIAVALSRNVTNKQKLIYHIVKHIGRGGPRCRIILVSQVAKSSREHRPRSEIKETRKKKYSRHYGNTAEDCVQNEI